MDPDANWEEQERIRKDKRAGKDIDVDRLIDLQVALDEWVRNGGFKPRAWSSGKKPV